jgi:hypothetical protein
MADIIDANGAMYEVVADGAAEQAAIVVMRIVDEDGVRSVEVDSRPSVDDPRFAVVVKSGGLVVLVGDPAVVLGNPLPLDLGVRLEVPGFRRVTVPVVVPANPVIPFAAPPVTLRRTPVTLRGRAVISATGAPLAGGTLGYAPKPVIAGQSVLALGQVLPADVPDGTVLTGMALTAVGGALPVKIVQTRAPAGTSWLILNDRRDLAPGQILRLGPADRPSLARIGVVAVVPADLTKPGLVLLSTPLTATARQGDPAQAFTAGAPDASATIGLAFAGEALLLTAAVPTGDALVVGPAASGIPFTAAPATDADGYYSQPGIARLPRLDLTMSAPALSPRTVTWEPSAGTTRIDWRMSP